MEKRFGSTRKSTRSPRPMEEPEPEPVPANNTEGGMIPVQLRQEEMAVVRICHYSLSLSLLLLLQASDFQYHPSIISGLKETKSTRDNEDFKYNVEMKRDDLKHKNCIVLCASIMNYACENMKVDSPDLTLLITCTDYLFETEFCSGDDFIKGQVVGKEINDGLQIGVLYSKY